MSSLVFAVAVGHDLDAPHERYGDRNATLMLKLGRQNGTQLSQRDRCGPRAGSLPGSEASLDHVRNPCYGVSEMQLEFRVVPLIL